MAKKKKKNNMPRERTRDRSSSSTPSANGPPDAPLIPDIVRQIETYDKMAAQDIYEITNRPEVILQKSAFMYWLLSYTYSANSVQTDSSTSNECSILDLDPKGAAQFILQFRYPDRAIEDKVREYFRGNEFTWQDLEERFPPSYNGLDLMQFYCCIFVRYRRTYNEGKHINSKLAVILADHHRLY